MEAVTNDCVHWPVQQSDIITHEWFSYSARGEVTDVYESTLHSAGYYHTTATYFPHGGLNTLGVRWEKPLFKNTYAWWWNPELAKRWLTFLRNHREASRIGLPKWSIGPYHHT
jgi:hypothetical protein